MKSVAHTFATKEDKEKLVCVGEAFDPVTNYSKSDFLSPAKVGQKFGISTEDALKFMKKLRRNRSKFVLNSHVTDIIITFNGRTGVHLHPMATEAFQRYLDKQRG